MAQGSRQARLLNLKNTVDALPELIRRRRSRLFEKYKVLNERELHARYEIMLESYVKTVNVEAQLMVLMANRYILPAALGYQTEVGAERRGRQGGGRRVGEGKKLLTVFKDHRRLRKRRPTSWPRRSSTTATARPKHAKLHARHDRPGDGRAARARRQRSSCTSPSNVAAADLPRDALHQVARHASGSTDGEAGVRPALGPFSSPSALPPSPCALATLTAPTQWQPYTAKDITVKGSSPSASGRACTSAASASAGLHHLVWEILDNAVDEAMNGYASNIAVTLHKDGSSLTVADDGRGIPVDKHPKTKKSALEVIFTVLHAGGKFEGSNYKTAGGLHGVGASVVNALSKELVATVKRDGAQWEMRFKQGKPGRPLKKLGPARGTGTTVYFHPDRRSSRRSSSTPRSSASGSRSPATCTGA